MHRKFARLVLAATLLLGGLAMTRMGEAGGPPRTAGTTVVELFTSEGCSSCPPADAAMARLAAEAVASRSKVVFVAYHVDYWDYLGWRDPLGSAENSELQRRYAKALGTRRVYTPQMIVNGSVEFNGSDTERARKEIASGLAAPAETVIEPTVVWKGGVLETRVRVTGPPRLSGRPIEAVLTESDLEIPVTAGENSGRRLRHGHVARERVAGTLNAAGEAVMLLTPKRECEADKLRVVVLLRSADSMRIEGAGEIVVPDHGVLEERRP